MKAKMVALKGINKVMAQNNMGMPPMVMNRWVTMLLMLAVHQKRTEALLATRRSI